MIADSRISYNRRIAEMVLADDWRYSASHGFLRISLIATQTIIVTITTTMKIQSA
jgi:hypothetical protein